MQRSQIKGLLSSAIDLQPLIDEIPLGVVVLDTDRRIVLMNRALDGNAGDIIGNLETTKDLIPGPALHVQRLACEEILAGRCQLEHQSVCVDSVKGKRQARRHPAGALSMLAGKDQIL